MKTSLLIVLPVLLATMTGVAAAQSNLPGPGAESKSAGPSPFKSDKEKVSYSIGLKIGRTMKSQALDVDPKVIAQGLADGLAGAKALMTDEEMQAVMMAFQQKMEAKMQKDTEAVAEKNAKAGAEFLATNAKKPGVVTLPSGLQYKELKAGTGPSPKPTDSVVAHYHGTLIDGKVFDSSIQRGQPATFPVQGVIPGWTEALQLMKVGSKWQLYIPAKLAYGETGTDDGTIAPNATLIFDVELISIK